MHPTGKHPNNRQGSAAQSPHLDTLRALQGQGPAAGVDDRLLGILGQLFRQVEEIRVILAGRAKSHYSVEELAEMTGRSAYTIRRWIGEGRIVGTRIEGTGPRGRLLISRDQVQRLVASGMAAQIPPALID